MRILIAVAVLFLAAGPVLAGAVTYTFDVTSGLVSIVNWGQYSDTSGMVGTFALTVCQSDCHIGESDTFILEDCSLYNSYYVGASLALWGMTAYPGSIRLLDFEPECPSHIGPGGQGASDADAYLDLTMYLMTKCSCLSVITTSGWMEMDAPLGLDISTSVTRSDVATAALAFTFTREYSFPDVPWPFTLDLVFSVEGTAHVVPDPVLSGLTALGLGGAGAWLRRRGRKA